MYAKIFTTIYQGTLRGKSHPLLVFTNLLAHADASGEVEMHPRAISEEVGLSQEDVCSALLLLEQADVESRSPEEDGRRIVRIDAHRAWGWRIVNYKKYRAIRNEEDRREQNRLSQARWRERNQSKQSKPRSAQAQGEAQALKSLPTSSVVDADSGATPLPPCPYTELIQLFAEKLPELRQVAVLNQARKTALQARWREVCKADNFSAAQALEWFAWFFDEISNSKFLMGRVQQREGRSFRATFDWIFKPSNFLKIVEGNYQK